MSSDYRSFRVRFHHALGGFATAAAERMKTTMAAMWCAQS
jgi:hypothetical protein